MKIAVIGLGHVGLPLAMVFAESGVEVVGIEAVAARCDEINAGRSYIQDVSSEALKAMVEKGLIHATTDYAATEDCDADIICSADTAERQSRAGPHAGQGRDDCHGWPGTCGAASLSPSRTPPTRAPRRRCVQPLLEAPA